MNTKVAEHTGEVAERLEQYIKHKQMTRNSFAIEVGLSAAQLFYMLSRGKNFGIDKLLKILHRFPELNPNWIIRGEGPMELRVWNDGENGHPGDVAFVNGDKGIPLYNLDAPFMNQDANERMNYIEGYISIPSAPESEIALRVHGEGMAPSVRAGDIVMASALEDFYQIQWGDLYLIVTSELRTIKKLRPAQSPDEITLVPENPEHDPFSLRKDKIIALYHLRVIIRNMSM